MATVKPGQELLDEIGKYPTLDELLDRDPHAVPYTDQKLEEIIKQQRAERAFIQFKAGARAAKRQGVEEPIVADVPEDEDEEVS